MQETRVLSWVRKILWRRKWQPTTVFLPGESNGQRSMVCCSPWGCRVRHDLVTQQKLYPRKKTQGYICCCCYVASVVSNSVWPHRRQPTRLPHPWDSQGKSTGVSSHFLLQCMKVKSESEVTQSCPAPCDPMDHSLPGSSVHGIFQARVLEWVAIAFSSRMCIWIQKYPTPNKEICIVFGIQIKVMRHAKMQDIMMHYRITD